MPYFTEVFGLAMLWIILKKSSSLWLVVEKCFSIGP